MPIDRRHFLLGGLGLATAGAGLALGLKTEEAPIPGVIAGANAAAGHRLRQGDFPPVTEEKTHQVIIVGGGIAGLSAAWKLQQAGVQDYALLELEDALGGNAQSGRNAVSAYPWGAHYVPLLTEEAKAARELFEELGIITGMQGGAPVYNEYYLCADPHERLFLAGRWQDGLVPQLGSSAADRAQYEAFFTAMEQYKTLQGADGKRAFAIPLAYSSQDAALLALDKISMADFMTQRDWTASPLRWYVDYCCRDDYGAPASAVSAWAGIHYFAARNGRAANADPQAVVTWPEGNGWIVVQLRQKLQGATHTGMLAHAVQAAADHAAVTCLDLARNVSVRYKARAVILAVPNFVAGRLTGQTDPIKHHYSPWMVANVTLDALPRGHGVRLAWDNVIYESKLLGYVVATHQNLNRTALGTVLTYYWPLDHLPPDAARREALQRPYAEWQKLVLDELYRIHPELKGQVRRLDVWLWGHGMVRPVPDYIWRPERQHKAAGPIYPAHSDLSGVAIFEEANYHGVRAAEAVLAQLAIPFRSSL